MTTSYFTIMMNNLEHMQIETVAAADSDMERPARSDGRWKAMDCNRFLLVIEGRGRLSARQFSEPLAPGSFGLVLAGTAHAIEVDEGQVLKLKWVHFKSSFGDREWYNSLGLPIVIQAPDEEPLRLMDKVIREVTRDSLTSRLRCKAAVLELISHYLEGLKPVQVRTGGNPPQDLEKINIVLQYIDEHLADNLSVDELSRLIYLHPNYFIVFFKSMMGCAPIQYVNLRRMEIARSMLLQPECNVSDVSARIGMKIYYFSRMFKKHTGMTPSQYRKMGTSMPGAIVLEAEASEVLV
ncbi:AraC family transcriptional regulator [Cohnella fermenti]|uniref:AraC family transcriptional regulator n=1 Tax=Cohnella fermenti TaxID=2565925 RepID=A0A4S4BH01_9BACL|nr:AraC family transcriptional regulator [Cohnella fermenti]THF72658.1 AraC family transcriptional regulator [Cohnella fermenti]